MSRGERNGGSKRPLLRGFVSVIRLEGVKHVCEKNTYMIRETDRSDNFGAV